MKKENIFIDLDKCSESEIKELALVMMRTKKLHEKAFNYMSKGKTFDHFICLAQTDSKEWTLWNINALFNKAELTYPEFIKLFEGGDVENETSLQIAIKALENIINPIGYMKSQLEEGDTLNGGYVIMLSENPQFYQNIAKEALKKINSNQ